ncbi:hypothetical protein BGX31_002965 [Mortierella sp. GBA43]|nr:hypothetical protein BGX31_002965 [Mortierella sp. GBA43]
MREIRNQGSGYDDQQQGQGQGQGQGRGREFESGGPYSEHGKAQSNWPTQDSRSYKSEDQDQDDIAASLVSLSGNAPGRAASHGARDGDYDMREPEPSTMDESRNSLRDDESLPRRGQEQQPLMHEDQAPFDSREQHPNSRPSSMSKQHHEQQLEQQRGEHGSAENEAREDPAVRSSSPQHGFGMTSGDQGRALPSPRDAEAHSGAPGEVPRTVESSTAVHEEYGETSLGPDSTGPGPRSSTEETKDAPVSSYGAGGADSAGSGIHGNNTSSSTQAPGGGTSESGANPGAGTGTNSEGLVGSTGSEEASKRMSLVAADEDTEMEEGEVREDEDEVMSSGAVPTVAQGKEDGK